MLPKRQRLPIPSVFGRRAVSWRTPYLFLRRFPAQGKNSRFGVIVGKNVAKRATERNRIKRLVMDVVGETQRTLPAYDYLIVVQKKMDLPKEKLAQEFSTALAKVLGKP